MHPSHRLTRLALGAALVPAASLTLPQPAAAHDGGSGLRPIAWQEECHTWALTAEEIDAGETSEITCEWAVEGAVATMATSDEYKLATHYSGPSGFGTMLSVYGTNCNGGGVSFGAGDPWDDRIVSTRHYLCGTIKHFEHSDYSGIEETTTGTWGSVHNLGQDLYQETSAIEYH